MCQMNIFQCANSLQGIFSTKMIAEFYMIFELKPKGKSGIKLHQKQFSTRKNQQENTVDCVFGHHCAAFQSENDEKN